MLLFHILWASPLFEIFFNKIISLYTFIFNLFDHSYIVKVYKLVLSLVLTC